MVWSGDSDINKEGWLYKRGYNNTKFQKRYFVLRNETLKYYKQQKVCPGPTQHETRQIVACKLHCMHCMYVLLSVIILGVVLTLTNCIHTRIMHTHTTYTRTHACIPSHMHASRTLSRAVAFLFVMQ